MDITQDGEYLEMYHQRIGDIQDVSDFIAIANTQLNKVLQRFGWTKMSLTKKKNTKLQQCSIEQHHKVKGNNLDKHEEVCRLRKNKIISLKEKDLCPDPSYSYEGCSNIVPVFINSQEYKELGYQIGCEKQSSQDENGTLSLAEKNKAINEYIARDPLDELRFIYSWQKIPEKYFTLSNHQIPLTVLKEWLYENIKTMNNAPCATTALINSILSWLNTSLSADQLLAYVEEMLGKESKTLVLNLWKFVSAKSLCLRQQIPEHTRNEFDFYSISINQSPATPTLDLSMESLYKKQPFFLPMEWVYYNLNNKEKLKIYEQAVQIGKLVSESSLKFTELAAEAAEQMKVLAELNAERSGQKTNLEIMAEMRDYKRRRLSYRGKNKANRKMTGLEVLREVVEQQMLYFKILQSKHDDSKTSLSTTSQYLTNEVVVKKEVEPPNEDNQRKIESESRSSSRYRQRSRSRDRHRSKSGERHRSKSCERRRSKNRETNDSTSQDRRRSRDYGRDRSRSRGRYSSRSDKNRSSHSNERRRGERTYREKNEISNITYY